jgi:hypothetical protein
MELTIVNTDPKYTAVKLIEPTTLGYIHIAAEVAPRRLPFLPNGREKSALLRKLKELARQLERLDAVERATVFDAIAFAPPSAYVQEQKGAVHVAHFDIVVLIETTELSTTRDVQTTPAYQALVGALNSNAKRMHIITARNVKHIGDVDRSKKGLFLFNYFVGDDSQVTLELWDFLADWYEVETGLATSVLLAPLEGEHSDYRIINYAQWEERLPRVLWRQLSKKSFRNYMLANLAANRVGAMAVMYRLA